jgi:pyruvate kinase
VDKCLKAGKIVIIATQMLESMIENTRPTRAELTDMANAVLDGTSALMLSGETASGKNVLKCIETMSEVIESCEKNIIVKTEIASIDSSSDISTSIAYACKSLVDKIKARAIVVVSKTGKSVLEVSGFKPNCPIVACTLDEKVYHQLALCWGTVPMMIEEFKFTDTLLSASKTCAIKTGLFEKGDVIIQTAGLPLGHVPTNLMKIDVL